MSNKFQAKIIEIEMQRAAESTLPAYVVYAGGNGACITREFIDPRCEANRDKARNAPAVTDDAI